MAERRPGRSGVSRALRVALSVGLVALLVGCEWTTFGDDDAPVRLDTRDAPPAAVPVPELVEVWRGWTGGGVTAPVAVGDGAVYVGSDDGFLYAFDEAAAAGCARYSCWPRWRAAVGAPVTAAPVAAGGLVYVASATRGLLAFDPARCAALPWNRCAPAWVGTTHGPIGGSPAVAGDLVVVGTHEGQVDAFAAGGCGATMCPPAWSGDVGAPVAASPVMAEGVVYVAAGDGRVVAFDAAGCAGVAAACAPAWVSEARAGLTAPAVADGVLYVGSRRGVLAYDPDRCVRRASTVCRAAWTGETEGAVSTAPVVAHGVVYVGTEERRPERVRSAEAGAAPSGGAGERAHGRLAAFDTGSTDACSSGRVCTPRWTGATAGAVTGITITEGLVLVGSDAALEVFLAAATCPGTPGVCEPGRARSVGGAPIAANGVTYVGAASGGVVAVRAVVDPLDPAFRGLVVTPERRDAYSVDGERDATVVAAPTNTGLDTRMSFVRRADPVARDEQSCATWTNQGAGWNQQGAVLRARELPDGTRRGVLVTKNIWMNAHWIFNVHVWDTSTFEVFQPIAHFDLAETFRPGGQVLPLPWSMCARVVGEVVSFIVWPANGPRPAWNDPRYGGSVRLPAGWSEPGRAGWYAGHLGPGHAVGLSGLDAGPVEPDGHARPGFGPEPTTEPKLPAPVLARL